MAFSRSRRSQSTGNYSKQSRGQTRRKDETSEDNPTGAKSTRSRKPFPKTGVNSNRKFSGSSTRGSSQNRRTGNSPRSKDYAGKGEFSERRERNDEAEKPRSTRSFISERPRTSRKNETGAPYGSRPKSRSNTYERSETKARFDNTRSQISEGGRAPRKPSSEKTYRDREKFSGNTGDRTQRDSRSERPRSTRSAASEGTRTYRKPNAEKAYAPKQKTWGENSVRSAASEGTRTYRKPNTEKAYAPKQKTWGENSVRSASRSTSEYGQKSRVKTSGTSGFKKENIEFTEKPKKLNRNEGEELKPTRTPGIKRAVKGTTDSRVNKGQSPKPTTDKNKSLKGQKPITRKTEPGLKAKSRAKQKANKENIGTRVNKYLADSGVGSRRAVEELITKGEVKINRIVVTDLSTRIMPGDFVTVKGEPITDVRRLIYILLNKPKDVITTADDEFGRKTVLDLIKTDKRLFPVGRLDRNTTGVLLLTNDGELAHRLTHPSYAIPRVYNVTLNEPLEHAHARHIAKGVVLDDGEETQPCEIFIDPTDGRKLILELREGKNREVRRIFEKFGYDVRKLDRKFFATLSTRGLARGKYRVLTRRELSELRQLTGLE